MDTLFFIASKTVWFFLRPDTLLLLLFILPWILLLRGRNSAATKTLGFALCVMGLIGIFPVGNFALNPLERMYPASPAIDAPTGIIVLGGMEEEAPEFAGRIAQVNEAGERLIVTLELARRFPDAMVLFSGGRATISLAEQGAFEIGPDILRRMGLPEGRLMIEGRSRSTAENAAFSRAMVPKDANGPWLLVTSAFHMPRALATFCAAGWRDLIPYPVDYRGGGVWGDAKWNPAGHLQDLNTGIKEWIGLAAYRATGRTETLLPEGCG